MADTNKWRMAAKDKGLCISCGKPRNRDGVYCDLCLEKERDRYKKDKDFFVEMGICYVCRKKNYLGMKKYVLNVLLKIMNNKRKEIRKKEKNTNETIWNGEKK